MWPRDGTDHIADRTTRNVWIDTRASRHEPRIMRVRDDGASRTRTGDLLGAITPHRHALRLVPLVQVP